MQEKMAISAVDTNIDVETLAIEESSLDQSPIAIPKWLDQHFLLKHLRKYYSDPKLAIQSFLVKSATAKGENYASSIYRVSVQMADGEKTNRNLNIILKTALASDFAFDTLSECDVYDKEIDFYERIAPQIQALLEPLNENRQLLAEIYGVCERNKVILFEDLAIKGYCLSPTQRGFDLPSAKIILQKAAALHACGAVLQYKQPDIYENFKHGLISRATDKLNTFYLTQFDAAIEVIAKWPDSGAYIDKLRRLRDNLMEKGRRAFDADPKHFNTMIHGDMWTNNLLMKYANNNGGDSEQQSAVENMIYLDFQFSCWTSPAIDLHYFFNTSVNETIRENHMNELIEFYHGHLAKYLERLNYQDHIPTLDEFQKQFLDKSFYGLLRGFSLAFSLCGMILILKFFSIPSRALGFIASCLIQPIMLNEHTDNADFEALALGDERSIEFKRLIYSSAKIQNNLKKLIPFYEKLGIFD